MKKILIVTDAWAPQQNGVVTIQAQYAVTLKERGYDVVFMRPEQFRNVRLPIYPEIHLALFPRRRVAAMIEQLKPDAIHLMVEGPLGWAARSVCMQKGIPFTTGFHTNIQLHVKAYLPGFTRLIYFLLRRFHSTAVCNMVSTASLKRELESTCFRNVVVVPLGVDSELFTRNAEPKLPLFPKPVFVYFGRLSVEKSPEEFLKLELPGTKVVMGDGPLFEKLKKKYPDARFLGRYKAGSKFAEQLSQCDVFVFPSRTETFGLVVLEALASGLPVAAHDVMGPRDIITDGKDGYLSEDLGEAALKCLKISREDCRAKALQYTWGHSTDAFIKNLHFIGS